LGKFHDLKLQGRSINKNLYESHAFKNPDILEKLVAYCKIVEIGSNYPTELFDPLNLPTNDFYDALAKEQSAFFEAKDKGKQLQIPEKSKINNPPKGSTGSKWDFSEQKDLPQSLKEGNKSEKDKKNNTKQSSSKSTYDVSSGAYADFAKEKKRQLELEKLKEKKTKSQKTE